MSNSKDVLDWEDLPPEDQARAEELLQELNKLFDRNLKKKDEVNCEDSTSED